jgi:hypothetical protein
MHANTQKPDQTVFANGNIQWKCTMRVRENDSNFKWSAAITMECGLLPQIVWHIFCISLTNRDETMHP